MHFLLMSANTLAQQLDIFPFPDQKNISNTQTEAHSIENHVNLKKTPITQSECFLIVAVFQRRGMDELHLHADMMRSHDVNNVSCYQLLPGDCWEHFLSIWGCWVLQRTVTVTRGEETARISSRRRFTLQFPLPLSSSFSPLRPLPPPGSWP